MVPEINDCVSICPMTIYASDILNDCPTALCRSQTSKGNTTGKNDMNNTYEIIRRQVTSLLLFYSQDNKNTFLILGTTNGEVLFIPLDDTKETSDISKHEISSSSPVTALAFGKITSQEGPEVVAICADGTTVALNPPNLVGTWVPDLVFEQRLQANITTAFITDIDKDNHQELVAVLTDRVVRTFRWSQNDKRLLPINKWEVPCQITAFGIGEGMNRKMEVWLSQLDNTYYACLPLSGKSEVNICRHNCYRDRALMAIPAKTDFTSVLGSLINHVVIVSNNQEKVLRHFGWPVIATSIVNFSHFTVIITLHLRGQVLLYAFSNKTGLKESEVYPYEKFTSLPASERLYAIPKNYSVLIGVSDCEGRYVVIT
ncbi:unnamed protein product [Auanema sp. JU1783]|nr:unnamed protein product [Auanema sp. JU1783]